MKKKAPSGAAGTKRFRRPRKRKAGAEVPSGSGRHDNGASDRESRAAAASQPLDDVPDWAETPLPSTAAPAPPAPWAKLRAREQRQRQLQFFREYFSNPSFLEVSSAPVTTSSSKAEVEKRRADISYRLDVLEALAAVCRDELEMLSKIDTSGSNPAREDNVLAPRRKKRGGTTGDRPGPSRR